jgi:hypothetical protein
MIVCGSYTGKQKKPCKHCIHFFLWGVGTGYCSKHKCDMFCNDHCKYFKRDYDYWTKDGKCKVDENLLYV